MSGKASRDRGARWERDIAHHLIFRGWAHAKRELERRKDVGDIADGPRGVVLEAKDRGRYDFAGWLAQARKARRTPDDLAVVVVKRRNFAVSEAFAVLTFDDLCTLMKEAGR